MRILNFGSLNIDKTYKVEHFVREKETIKALKYEEFSGGKGLNQSVALAKAGARVVHAGCIGNDGDRLVSLLADSGANTDYIRVCGGPSGHAIIQVDEAGQNSIIIYGGANDEITKGYIEKVLDDFGPGDMLLVQNEIQNVAYAISRAKQKGIKIAFNPSPINDGLEECDLHSVDYFILNEVEGEWLSRESRDNPKAMMKKLTQDYPKAAFVLTLGDKGAYYFDSIQKIYQEIYKVEAVDTTGAGDTFTGYFLAGIANGRPVPEALKYASIAAAISVSRKGAAGSIPNMEEVAAFSENFSS